MPALVILLLQELVGFIQLRLKLRSPLQVDVNGVSLMVIQGDRVGLNQGTEYEVISDVEGTLIRVSDDIRMLLLNQDYEEFLAAGSDAIARIAV